MSSNNVMRIGKNKSTVKMGDKVHDKDGQNYYYLEREDENCVVIIVDNPSKPFSPFGLDEDDLTFLPPELLEKGWVGFENNSSSSSSAAAAGAGAGQEQKKFKIGVTPNTFVVQKDDRVHNKDSLENYYFVECINISEGLICIVKDPITNRNLPPVHHYSLKPGWIDPKIKKEKEEKARKEWVNWVQGPRKKLMHAVDVMNNTHPLYFGESLRILPPKTTCFFRDADGSIKGFFVTKVNYGIGYSVFIYDVRTNQGEEIQFLESNIDRINVRVYPDLPEYRKQKAQTSTSSSAAGAGAGASASSQSETKEEKEKRECYEFLASKGIESLSDFKSWAVKGGHPNKGGDKEFFQKISDCVDKTFKIEKPKNNSQQGGKKNRKNRKRNTRKH